MTAMTYWIMTRPDGSATLSKSGHWGNMPYPDPTAARQAAASDAGGAPFIVETGRTRY